MAVTIGRVRSIALAMIGAGSVLAGLFFAFRLVTPSLIAQLPTPELMGLLGLLILPPLSAWALWADRSARTNLPAAPDSMMDRIVEPKPLILEDPSLESELGSEVELVAEQVAEPEVHAPGRRTVRHRRHDPARTTA